MAFFFFGVAVVLPYLGWGCCGVVFSTLLLGGVVLSPFYWCCQICSSSLSKDNFMVQWLCFLPPSPPV